MSQIEYPFIIAEVGFNHGGSLELAEAMISAAAESGASAVKLQTYIADDLATRDAPHYDLIASGALDLEAHMRLFEYASNLGTSLFSTPFGKRAIEILETVDAPYYKIASMDLNNLPLLKDVASRGKPIFLSTGMSSLNEIEEAIQTITSTSKSEIVLLHCVSHYPTKIKDAYLQAIPKLRESFNLPVGYSDHTLGNCSASAAIALGAQVIEKHFTTNKALDGPDHQISADPAEMKQLVEASKSIYAATQSNTDLSDRPDLKEAALFRRSIHAATNIPQGKTIEKSMLKAIRPGSGLPPHKADSLIGKIATRDISIDTLLQSSDLS